MVREQPCSSHTAAVTLQRQELESENKKLKHDLAEVRQSLLKDASASTGAPGSPAYKVLLEQLTASCEELDVRKEEVLILRSQLVSQKEAMQHKVGELSCCRMLAHALPTSSRLHATSAHMLLHWFGTDPQWFLQSQAYWPFPALLPVSNSRLTFSPPSMLAHRMRRYS